MKGLKFIAAAVVLMMLQTGTALARSDRDITVTLDPSNASKFNDGKFEGWGTSLCWWANRVGYDETLTNKAAKLFYSDDGLSLDIARYNVGGGDNPSHNHITRSDSKVPGYATGYDENGNIVYDWTADENQRNVAIAAKKANSDIYFEGFSNSPPYFMTNSGCSSGATMAKYDNLRFTDYDNFAEYIAQVSEHFKNEWGIEFKSYSPMNEPYTNYWGENSFKQEGCHFEHGYSQSKMIISTRNALDNHGLNDVLVAGTDETSVDTAITSLNMLSDDALNALGRVDTHTYGGTKRKELKTLVESKNKNLWMSEVDGSYTAGTNAEYMSAGLGLGKQIIKDMNGMMPSAWIMWDIIDSHKDNTSVYRVEGEAETKISQTGGIWGVAMADHDSKDIVLTKKYYAFGQFTRYIEPNMTIISSDENTLAAYDMDSGRIVIVAVNTDETDNDRIYNLEQMPVVGGTAKVVRTSGGLDDENWAEIGNVQIQNKQLYVSLKGNSITTFIIDAGDELERIATDIAPDTEIRTDQYMPTEYNGATIKWSTDNDVVSNNGVVTRNNGDTKVNIIAEITKGDTKMSKTYDCTVKASPQGKTENDMKAYLFVHFVGTENSEDCEQIYFSVSKDGETWKTLNNKLPVLKSVLGEKGVRDPHIVRSPEGDKFFLIATDLSIYNRSDDKNRWGTCQRFGSKSIMIWESDDLVHWSNQRMANIAPNNAGCTWAPESVYDSEKGQYMVFWASKVSDDDYSVQRIYRSYTTDFKHFTEPEVYIDDGNISNIDTTFINYDNNYYRFTKNESKSSVTMMSSNLINGDFKEISTYKLNDELGNEVTGYEGPTVYKINGENKWCLLLDYYSKSQGYKPFVTDDITKGEFKSADDFDFDMTYRHGTVIPITLEEYNNLVYEYATTDFSGCDKVKVGGSEKYTLDINGETVTPTWTVSDESIASISEDGVLEAKTIGNVTLNAYVKEYGLNVEKVVEVTKYSEIKLTKGMLDGSSAWNDGLVNTYENTVDNDLTTFFDGVEKGYVTIDLGKNHIIDAVGYAPRTKFAYRMKDAIFEGSLDGDKWTTLFKITDIPLENTMTDVELPKNSEYRYIRYSVPAGSHKYNPNSGKTEEYCCNISEIKLYGEPIEDINSGLAAHISFDENNTGNGSFVMQTGGKAIENGEVEYVDGINGNALKITYNTDNYVELPKGLLNGAASATVSFWLKQGESSKDGWPFMTTPVDTSQTYKSEKYLGVLLAKSQNKLTAECYYSNAEDRPIQASVNDSFGEWKYVTVIYQPNSTSIYINSQKIVENQSDTNLKELFAKDSTTWIGHANWGDGEGFDGMIDDFRLYNRTLSEKEIEEIYTIYK